MSAPDILEAYQLAEPHLAAPPEQEAEIPAEAFRTHAVLYVFNARVGGEISIRANSYALVKKATAKAMIADNDARGETVSERQMAIDNGHRRDAGKKAPEAKSLAAQAVPIEDDAPEAEAQAEAKGDGKAEAKPDAKKGGKAAKG